MPVAQLDRVSDSDSDGCRFDPCRVRQNIIEALLYRVFFYSERQQHSVTIRRFYIKKPLSNHHASFLQSTRLIASDESKQYEKRTAYPYGSYSYSHKIA